MVLTDSVPESLPGAGRVQFGRDVQNCEDAACDVGFGRAAFLRVPNQTGGTGAARCTRFPVSSVRLASGSRAAGAL